MGAKNTHLPCQMDASLSRVEPHVPAKGRINSAIAKHHTHECQIVYRPLPCALNGTGAPKKCLHHDARQAEWMGARHPPGIIMQAKKAGHRSAASMPMRALGVSKKRTNAEKHVATKVTTRKP
jgi:hypothetical protein